MKKILLVLVFLNALMISSQAGIVDNNYVHLDAIEIHPGETLVIPLLMTNSNTVSAVQGNIKLPEGLSFVTKSNGRPDVKGDDDRAEDFTLSCAIQDDGSLTFAQYSGDGFTYAGNSGSIFTFKIKADDNASAGTYQVSLRDVVISISGVGYEYPDRTSVLTVLGQDPVTITANNLTMVYGEAVPELTFSSEGATLEGTPTLSCEATSTSPVGTYPIIVTQGSVTNTNVTFVNGTLTITKAPLTVKAGTYSREEGEANPEFTLTYEGFKNNETVEVLTSLPVATTTATVDSPAGEYVVSVSGGEAQNYSFTYVNGILNITPSTGIGAMLSNGQTFDIYDLNGSRLYQQQQTMPILPRGIYIINGRKVVVK